MMALELVQAVEHAKAIRDLNSDDFRVRVIVTVPLPANMLAVAADALREEGWHIGQGYEDQYLVARPRSDDWSCSIHLEPPAAKPTRAVPPHPEVAAYVKRQLAA